MIMNYKIESIAFYLPEKIITNKYLAEEAGIDVEFLENKIGIKERRIAVNETVSEMSAKAITKLLDATGIDKSEIDLLLICTQNPDYKLPTTACLVQNTLQLRASSICFDVNLGCSGFTYSLPIAGNFIKTGIVKKALLVMSDQYSKLINYKDKNTASLFGDAASAILLTACNENEGVLDIDFGTDGSGGQNLIAFNSGTVQQSDKNTELYMNGREIFKFSITVVPESVNKILSKNNLKVTDIKHFIFHQANKYMLGEIKKKLQLTDNQMIIDMENYGNTVSSTIPIALKNLMDKNELKKGDLLVFSGFGVGLSWGTVLYKF